MLGNCKVTANQVTVARILLLPVPVYLLIFGSTSSVWLAFFWILLLGATDFVDGLMARREGPTRLGGLLDPVADKIFVAALVLTLAGTQKIPSWIPVAILSREFTLTVLRSSVALRDKSIETSWLGKWKTIIQMGGLGTVFLTFALSLPQALLASFLLFFSLFVLWVFWKIKYPGPAPHWILPVSLCFLYWFSLLYFFQIQTVVLWILTVIVAITWISALDYLSGSYRVFMQGGLHSYDVRRLAWALAYTFCVVPVACSHPMAVLPLWVVLSFELALGGVDNVVVAEKKYAMEWPFRVSMLAALLFGLVAYDVDHKMVLFVGLALVSFLNFSFTYYRWRSLFARVLLG